MSWDLASTFTGTTPTDERIEHQIEELVGKLEAHASPSPGSWCPSFNDGKSLGATMRFAMLPNGFLR